MIRQPTMPKPNSLIGRIPLAEAIGTPCRHVIPNAPELDPIDRIGSVMIGVNASDAAHEFAAQFVRNMGLLGKQDSSDLPMRPEDPGDTLGSPKAGCARG